MTMTRPPAVAGAFYPGSPALLSATVDQLLAEAPAAAMPQPKALIVPHAGYIYSGSTAAMAYAALAPWHATIRRVILLGPTHRVAVNGLAVPKSGAFATPLGSIPLDAAALARLAELPQVVFSDHAHAQEHSLEVHLPFLQRVLDDFTLVPLAVGHATPRDVAEVLDLLWGGPETLIVISSDLSHFLPYAAATQVDRDTCAAHPATRRPHPARAGLRRLPDQRPAARCPPARADAAADPPLQFRRHRRRPAARRRLCSLRLP